MDEQTSAPASSPTRAPRKRTMILFALATAAWFALDVATKGWVAGGWEQGEVIAGPFFGLVRFHLVHNTGMAWGMFGDSTFFLGVMSLAVCAAVTAYLLALAGRLTALEAVGTALVVGGGLGNALDRFTLGYVVDFIEPVFIDFPVFNVADIGVTCGFVLVVLGLVLRERREAALLGAEEGADGKSGDDEGEGR